MMISVENCKLFGPCDFTAPPHRGRSIWNIVTVVVVKKTVQHRHVTDKQTDSTCMEVSGVENIGQCGRLSQLGWLLGAF